MKTVKEILERQQLVTEADHLSKYDKAVDSTSVRDLPAVIILKRKSVRVFPDNQRVGLYYSQALDKYISIPYGPDNKALGMQLSENQVQEEIKMDRKLVAESFRSKLNTIRESKQEEQLDEFIVPLVQGAVRAAIQSGAAGAAVKFGQKAIRGGINLGKRALNSFRNKTKSASDPTNPMKKYDKQPKPPGPLRKTVDKVRKANSKLNYTEAGKQLAASFGINTKDLEGSGLGISKRELDGNYNFGKIDPKISTNGSAAISPPTAKDAEYNSRGYSIPRTSLSRVVQESNNLDIIRAIVESKQAEEISFGEASVTVTPRIAKKLLNVHESLNKTNKKKFEKMVNESADQFRKVLNFTLKA